MTIPGYIRDRLLRPIPPDCCVQPDAYPVIANGDPGLARIATVGLNPGGAEQRGTRSIEEEWERQKGYFHTAGSTTRATRLLSPLATLTSCVGQPVLGIGVKCLRRRERS